MSYQTNTLSVINFLNAGESLSTNGNLKKFVIMVLILSTLLIASFLVMLYFLLIENRSGIDNVSEGFIKSGPIIHTERNFSKELEAWERMEVLILEGGGSKEINHSDDEKVSFQIRSLKESLKGMRDVVIKLVGENGDFPEGEIESLDSKINRILDSVEGKIKREMDEVGFTKSILLSFNNELVTLLSEFSNFEDLGVVNIKMEKENCFETIVTSKIKDEKVAQFINSKERFELKFLNFTSDIAKKNRSLIYSYRKTNREIDGFFDYKRKGGRNFNLRSKGIGSLKYNECFKSIEKGSFLKSFFLYENKIVGYIEFKFI